MQSLNWSLPFCLAALLIACSSPQSEDQSEVISFLDDYYKLSEKHWENTPKISKLRQQYREEYVELVEPGTKEYQWNGKVLNVSGKAHGKLRLGAITFGVGKKIRVTCDVLDQDLMDKVTDYTINDRVSFTAIFKDDMTGWIGTGKTAHLICDLKDTHK